MYPSPVWPLWYCVLAISNPIRQVAAADTIDCSFVTPRLADLTASAACARTCSLLAETKNDTVSLVTHPSIALGDHCTCVVTARTKTGFCDRHFSPGEARLGTARVAWRGVGGGASGDHKSCRHAPGLTHGRVGLWVSPKRGDAAVRLSYTCNCGCHGARTYPRARTVPRGRELSFFECPPALHAQLYHARARCRMPSWIHMSRAMSTATRDE